jgi:hypothetical protein
MNTRRQVLSGIPLLLLAGCAGAKLPELPVSVTLPTELTTLISDTTAIYDSVKSLSLPTSVTSFIDRMKADVSAIASSKLLSETKTALSDFSSTWQQIKSFIPTTGTAGEIVTAVETVLPIALKVAGLVSMFARSRPTGMSVEQARAILYRKV